MIIAVNFANLSNWKDKGLKNKSFNGIRTRHLRDTGAMLYQNMETFFGVKGMRLKNSLEEQGFRNNETCVEIGKSREVRSSLVKRSHENSSFEKQRTDKLWL